MFMQRCPAIGLGMKENKQLNRQTKALYTHPSSRSILINFGSGIFNTFRSMEHA